MSSRRKKNGPILTTPRQFEYFKACALRYSELLGLDGWRFDFTHQDLSDALAKCRTDLAAHIATIGLATTWSATSEPVVPLTDDRLRMLAQHEVLHVFLAPLAELACERYVTEAQMVSAEEGLIHRLQLILNGGERGGAVVYGEPTRRKAA